MFHLFIILFCSFILFLDVFSLRFNIQAISRDILCYAMRTLSRCFIVGHVHDELILEVPESADLNAICEQMGRTPDWIEGILLRADGYETEFYKKD